MMKEKGKELAMLLEEFGKRGYSFHEIFMAYMVLKYKVRL